MYQVALKAPCNPVHKLILPKLLGLDIQFKANPPNTRKVINSANEAKNSLSADRLSTELLLDMTDSMS